MSMVLQEPYLFSGSVADNIRYNHEDASIREVIDAARTVGAHDFIIGLGNGYDTILAERGVNLSVGQRQLLSFARAIIGNPRIIILDEATANIDTQTELLIQRALQRVLEGRTSIVIAHRLSTVRNADKIIVLNRGRLVEMGTHKELLDVGGFYERLYAVNYGLVSEPLATLESNGEGSEALPGRGFAPLPADD
jgi:ATP-binding cassette subfamily B protein